MRPPLAPLLSLATLLLLLPGLLPAAEQLPTPFVVYHDDEPEQQLPYTPSGWMGDWEEVTFDRTSQEQPHEGARCIKIVYAATGAGHQGWAGIFWQRPANNWGDKDSGLDVTGARHLAFWARGAVGGEVIEKFQVGGIKGQFTDSCEVMIGPITLSNEWQEYLIPLEGKDLSHIIGGFMWATSRRANPQGCAFYLDHIRFE